MTEEKKESPAARTTELSSPWDLAHTKFSTRRGRVQPAPSPPPLLLGDWLVLGAGYLATGALVGLVVVGLLMQTSEVVR